MSNYGARKSKVPYATYQLSLLDKANHVGVIIVFIFGSSGEQPLEVTGKVRCESGAVPQL